jgi:hypothetical protein
MSKSKKKGYEVGYGRPPKDTQFRKGRSGNPKGRPKKRRDIVSTLERTLAEPFTYREGDQVREMPAEEGLMFAQVLKAMQGDQGAFNDVMKQAKRCRLILPRKKPGDGKPAGILVVPDPMTVEEWLGATDELGEKRS